jgi:hypothetical protein
MSTKGYVGMKEAGIDSYDPPILGIYIHFDGYPDQMGPILKTYHDFDEIMNLMEKGDMPALVTVEELAEADSYDTGPSESKTIQEFLKTAFHNDANYVYLYDEGDDEWKYIKYEIAYKYMDGPEAEIPWIKL